MFTDEARNEVYASKLAIRASRGLGIQHDGRLVVADAWEEKVTPDDVKQIAVLIRDWCTAVSKYQASVTDEQIGKIIRTRVLEYIRSFPDFERDVELREREMAQSYREDCELDEVAA